MWNGEIFLPATLRKSVKKFSARLLTQKTENFLVIESDPVGDYTRARMALQELDIDPDDVTTEDFSSLRYICEVVSRRASFMASAGITALLKKMDYKDVVIAIDGSLFRYDTVFENYQ